MEIRRALNLKAGDKVAISLNQEGKPEAILRPVRSGAEMTFGSDKRGNRPGDFQELRDMYEEGMAEEREIPSPEDVVHNPDELEPKTGHLTSNRSDRSRLFRRVKAIGARNANLNGDQLLEELERLDDQPSGRNDGIDRSM